MQERLPSGFAEPDGPQQTRRGRRHNERTAAPLSAPGIDRDDQENRRAGSGAAATGWGDRGSNSLPLAGMVIGSDSVRWCPAREMRITRGPAAATTPLAMRGGL